MVKFGILATLEAKIGKEHEVAAFLKSVLPLVEAEPGTVSWFAIRISAMSAFATSDICSAFSPFTTQSPISINSLATVSHQPTTDRFGPRR